MSIQIIDGTRLSTSSAAVFFYDVSHRGLFFAAAVFALVAGYIALPKGAGVNMAAALIPATLAALLVSGAIWRKFFRKGLSWIMAIDTDGIYINPGYNTGYETAIRDKRLFFLPAEAVLAVRKTREVMRLPHRFGATRHHFGYLDIMLAAPVTGEEMAVIQTATEHFSDAGKSGPFPVRFVTPLLLRLNLNAVLPGEKEALAQLSGSHQVVGMVKVIFPEWAELNAEQRDIYLEELWKMGMRDEAAFLARIHLKVSLTKAREILAEQDKAWRTSAAD